MGRKYIKVIAEFSKEGIIAPLSLFIDGNSYEITKVIESKRMAATKIGGTGYRYEIVVGNKTQYIWLEDVVFNKTIGAKWFIDSDALNV